MNKTYRQWAVTRSYTGGPFALTEEIRELCVTGNHMMIGSVEHVIGRITQVIPLSYEGDTTDVVILFDCWPLREVTAEIKGDEYPHRDSVGDSEC